jgi:mRNA-degrading endonuclease RelE of RelBE toxin-antitoxin system
VRAIAWTQTARADVRRIDREQAMFILRTLGEYARSGQGDAKPLKGADRFRLRVGNWRIVFDEGPNGAIRVLRVRHRSEAYR